jgi:protein required for attachment to host cells
MSRFWILAADHGGARIFATDKRGGDIEEIRTIQHPDGRLKEGDFISDGPGHGSGSDGNSQHPMTHENAHKNRDERRFAREIADHLRAAHQGKEFQELYIISAPGFLGALRDSLAGPVKESINQEISKDVTRQSAQQIRKQLPELL